MGGSSSRQSSLPPAIPDRRADYVSVTTEPIPGDTGIRVICPRCRAVLMPPAPLFRCPCGQLMTFSAPPGSGMVAPGGGGFMTLIGAGDMAGQQVHMRRSSRPNALEERMLFLLSRLPPDDPHAVFLRILLRRLPRRPDGSLNIEAVDAVARQLEMELRGAPQAMIELLPTRKFERASLPGELSTKEEHVQCMVCLEEYSDGNILRTLPCLHSFHKDCIDPWLKTNRSCPMCKTPIDVDQDELLARQLEQEASAAKTGGACAISSGSLPVAVAAAASVNIPSSGGGGTAAASAVAPPRTSV